MSTDQDDLSARLAALRAPAKDPPTDDALASRLAALSPKREPARPTAAEAVPSSDAEVDAYLNGEDWLGESVESSNRDLASFLPSTSTLREPSSTTASSSRRPQVSHRLSDAFNPIDIQVVLPPNAKTRERTAEEEQTLIDRLQNELAAEAEEAREAEKRQARLARLSTGLGQDEAEETWLGPPPGELQLPPDLKDDKREV